MGSVKRNPKSQRLHGHEQCEADGVLPRQFDGHDVHCSARNSDSCEGRLTKSANRTQSLSLFNE
jgi:hypothetical protein